MELEDKIIIIKKVLKKLEIKATVSTVQKLMSLDVFNTDTISSNKVVAIKITQASYTDPYFKDLRVYKPFDFYDIKSVKYKVNTMSRDEISFAVVDTCVKSRFYMYDTSKVVSYLNSIIDFIQTNMKTFTKDDVIRLIIYICRYKQDNDELTVTNINTAMENDFCYYITTYKSWMDLHGVSFGNSIDKVHRLEQILTDKVSPKTKLRCNTNVIPYSRLHTLASLVLKYVGYTEDVKLIKLLLSVFKDTYTGDPNSDVDICIHITKILYEDLNEALSKYMIFYPTVFKSVSTDIHSVRLSGKKAVKQSITGLIDTFHLYTEINEYIIKAVKNNIADILWECDVNYSDLTLLRMLILFNYFSANAKLATIEDICYMAVEAVLNNEYDRIVEKISLSIIRAGYDASNYNCELINSKFKMQ